MATAFWAYGLLNEHTHTHTLSLSLSLSLIVESPPPTPTPPPPPSRRPALLVATLVSVAAALAPPYYCENSQSDSQYVYMARHIALRLSVPFADPSCNNSHVSSAMSLTCEARHGRRHKASVLSQRFTT